MSDATLLTVGIGDIHGRFHRVQEWLGALESSLARSVDLAFAVGDVEAFVRADDHLRKAAKRSMPAEFVDYVHGTRTPKFPLYFIGGNNEDFETLHNVQEGGELAPGMNYLGRVGVRTFRGLRVGFLSGIFAPRFYEQPLAEPRSKDTAKQAGYFRKAEVEFLWNAPGVDLLLTHEWPRGLFRSPHATEGPSPRPWMGNKLTRELAGRVQPKWLLCGHSHMPWAATMRHSARAPLTHVACLDQAARPEAALFWVEWKGREPQRAGWGTSGAVAWERGQIWEADRAPLPQLPASLPEEPPEE